ncbi:MAG: S41 family peptidase [Candidatus Paceibacterota bacterium]|jgi:carboxyl-terminal processing protease|nr:S41 family peptidase [bacterium]
MNLKAMKNWGGVNWTIIVVVFIFFTGSFLGGFYFNQYVWQKKYDSAQENLKNIDLILLSDVISELNNSFVDSEKIDSKKITYGVIEGAVKSLGDPYTVFFDPKDSKEFKEDISGSFNGVGIQVGSKEGKLKVIAPIKGSPADKAGILPGDIILQVDKASISDMPIDDVIKKIKGEKGTKVSLTISRDSKIKDFEIKRDLIKVPTIDVSIKEEKGKKIAILSIYHFSEELYADFKKEIPVLATMDGIILDLRSNPGGLVSQTQEVISWFLKKGDVVYIQQDRMQNKETLTSFGYGGLENVPMVLIINEGSASAAEIMAGALRDNKGIKIIGQNSYGKGTVQKVVDLYDGSSVKITIAKWFTPSGLRIQDVGIKPDIEVKISEDDYLKDKDPQLDKALEEIKKIIK